MSNLINHRFSLCVSFLNQLITCSAFLFWFDIHFPVNITMMLVKYVLLIRLTSLFFGFMSMHLGLFLKLSLWSVNAMNACWSEYHSTLSSIPRCLENYLDSLSTYIYIFYAPRFTLLQVCVILSWRHFSYWSRDTS